MFVDITPELRMMYDHPILSQNRNTNTTTNVGDNSEPSGTNIQQNTEGDNTDMLTDYSENGMQHNIEENYTDVVQAQTDEGLGSDATQTNSSQTPCVIEAQHQTLAENRRRSCRDKHPPVWLKDFVSLNIH